MVELLEDRTVPSGTTISGFVFNDANNNGLFDPGESPIANNTIQLLNASGTVIGTAVTDANGFYQFTTDSTISTTPTTLTETASVPNTATDWTHGLTVAPFDPALGQLTSVDVINAGSFTSTIKVESMDNAPSTITATDSGILTLTGPDAIALITNSASNKTFNASAFDGVIDFGGTSGHDFGAQTANGSNMVTLTKASDLLAFETGGQISFSENAHATSAATGAGNLITQINTTAAAQISVVYHYIPSNALKPGSYTIVQTSTPPGFFDGLESSNGVAIPNSVGSHRIPVTLTNSSSANNDFGELLPASVAGFVYFDRNDNGVKEAGETGIASVTVTLTGTNDLGANINLIQTTAADGSYAFAGLRPGTYAVTETQPANYLSGKNSLGSLGGSQANNLFSSIVISQGSAGVNYNFAELLPASLSGFVYFDGNANGVKDAGDPGLGGVTVTLTGTNDQGSSVSVAQVTAGDGSYQFAGLRPGTYTLTKTPPANFLDGGQTLGSAGGVTGADNFSSIGLSSAVAGANYNFGELRPVPPTGVIYSSSFSMTSSSFDHPLDFQVLSKLQFLSSGGSSSMDPRILVEATFVDGLYHALLGRTPDSAGLFIWVQQLENGVSRSQVVDSFWASAEHRGLEVDRMYQTFLHRGADAGGRAAWVNAFMSGASEFDVARAIINSPEYQSAHASNLAYISGLYADILGRTPSQAEISTWLQILQNGTSRDAVAVAFLTSGEAYVLILNQDYQMYLHRNADAGGEQVWLAMLQNGQATPQTVSEAFLASDEFFAMARQAAGV
jgi:hypothetical protein